MPCREIPEEIVSLVEGGGIAMLATCGADLMPECTRVRGARVSQTRREVIVYVPVAQAGNTFENLRDQRRAAVSFTDVTNYRTVQIKGEVLSVRTADASEQELQARHMREFAAAIKSLGYRSDPAATFVYWPSNAVEIRVDQLYMQTPG